MELSTTAEGSSRTLGAPSRTAGCHRTFFGCSLPGYIAGIVCSSAAGRLQVARSLLGFHTMTVIHKIAVGPSTTAAIHTIVARHKVAAQSRTASHMTIAGEQSTTVEIHS